MSQAIDKRIVEELLALERGGDTSLLVDMIRTFHKHGPDHVEMVLEGLDTQNLSRLGQGALTLRSMAGSLGAFDLLRTCERLLSVSRRHEWDELRELALLLRTQFEDAFQALERLLERYG